jgi:hypothetical protein
MRTYKLLIKELPGLLTEVINNTIASGNEPWQTDPVPKVHTPKNQEVRPITFLQTFYKLIDKVISGRLQ